MKGVPRSPESTEFDELGITVDRRADVPLGVQLAWALRSRIRDGRLRPGQRLPGLRDLAEALGVNVNTVRSVYQRLEQEELIDSQQGSGTFVASTLKLPSAVGTIAANAAREAQETGVDPREVAAALYVAPESPVHPTGEMAVRRRRLRSQIAALEQTLADIQAKYPGLDSTPAEAPHIRGPRLLDVPDLEAIQTKLLRRLVSLQGAIDELSSQGPVIDQGPEEKSKPQREPAQSRAHVPKAPKARGKARPATAGA